LSNLAGCLALRKKNFSTTGTKSATTALKTMPLNRWTQLQRRSSTPFSKNSHCAWLIRMTAQPGNPTAFSGGSKPDTESTLSRPLLLTCGERYPSIRHTVPGTLNQAHSTGKGQSDE